MVMVVMSRRSVCGAGDSDDRDYELFFLEFLPVVSSLGYAGFLTFLCSTVWFLGTILILFHPENPDSGLYGSLHSRLRTKVAQYKNLSGNSASFF